MKESPGSGDIQKEFFKQIKTKLPGNKQLSPEIASVLNVSEVSAYRRINGEIQLTFEEILILVNTFAVSIDNLALKSTDQYFFSGYLLDGTAGSFSQYLKNMADALAGINESNGQLICFNKDIPVFYQFFFPELAWFKYYFWQKHILLVPEFQQKKFKKTECPKELEETGYQVYYHYQNISSTELWNIESVNTTLRQLVYSQKVNDFEDVAALNDMLDQLTRLIEIVKQQAVTGKKISFSENGHFSQTEHDYSMYYNDFFLADNSIIAIIDGRLKSFVNHSVINYIQTDDAAFNNHLHHHFKNIISRSTLISSSNPKEREAFFSSIFKKLSQFKK